MKTFIKVMIVVLFAMWGSEAVLAGDVAVPDEPLPPEVQKLIGMKIPPRVVGRKTGRIPNFIVFGGAVLNLKVGKEKTEFGYKEGVFLEKWPIFMVSAYHEDRTIEIVDVALLPEAKLNWRYKDGEIRRLEGGEYLIFSASCHFANTSGHPIDDGRIIFGLEDPNYEHDSYSTRIERAWEIDPQTGRIRSIPTQGVICAILGE